MLFILQSLLFVSSLFPILVPAVESKVNYTILPSSSLYIQGYSNVNNFTCIFEMQHVRPVKVKYVNSQKELEFISTEFPVSSFDCGSAVINKDFRNLLNEKAHPLLYMRLLSVTPLSESRVKVSLEFKIAGVSNLYDIMVDYKKEVTHLHTKGSFQLNIEDHGLAQPKRLLGLIVVRKQIDVYFDIDFI